MQVERHCAVRHRMDLPVYIRYRRRRFHAARARELSSVGMTLAVQSLTLPNGTPIELEFRGPGRSWLIAAAVTYSDNSGIGCIFRDPQPALVRDLTESAAVTPPPLATGAVGQSLPQYCRGE